MDESVQVSDAESLSGLGGVSRETRARLERYHSLLERWQARINLVSPATLPQAWVRHFADSAQLLTLAPDRPARWIDLGSGAGFPGLVAAHILAERSPQTPVYLVESDARKAAFLQTVIAETGLAQTGMTVRVLPLRAAAAARELGAGPGVISARALAPLPRLLDLAWPFWGRGSVGLFPKGQDVEAELTEAAKYWNISASRHPSATAPEGVILKVEDLTRVEP